MSIKATLIQLVGPGVQFSHNSDYRQL